MLYAINEYIIVIVSDNRGFVDDSRLSRLVRRVTREDDRDARITNLRQLADFLASHENAKVNVILDQYCT